MTVQPPMIIAHRGAKGMSPENTLAAFRLGLEQGCQGIELDVHLTADGEIVVIHDGTLERTTNGQGRIGEMTLAEIKQYDAGLWFGETYRGETVPTLGELFDLVPPEIMVNIEVKDHYGQRMEPALVDFLRKRERLDNVVISSFDHKCVRRIKLLEPKAKIGLLYQNMLVDAAAYARSFDVDVYSLHPFHRNWDEEDLAKALDCGLKVYTWTANETEDLRRLTDMGVSGIITDYPGRLKELLTGN